MKEVPRRRKSGFVGNRRDLAEFRRLADSPIRSAEREAALRAWSAYKLAKQAAYRKRETARYVREKRYPPRMAKNLRRWVKGDYEQSLRAPAIDLRGALLHNVCVGYADLRGVRLDNAQFLARERGSVAMKGTSFQFASLRGANLRGAQLMEADFRNADLSGADLSEADLTGANLTGANLRGTNLCRSRVYGVSAWDVIIDEDESLRRDLVVTPPGQADVTVDNVEVAQFVYLLLKNPKIRDVIDTVCRKGVLILGRFTPERKAVLDALRSALRQRGYVAMLFDFNKPTERDITETVKTLAGLSRFIIADITNPKSSPLELQATVPDYMVPVVPIIEEGGNPFSMFVDLHNKYNWVLEPLEYPNVKALIDVLDPAIIKPALDKHGELLAARGKAIRTRKVSEYQGE